MTSPPPPDDKLDEVLAELEAARGEPVWTSEHETGPRRLIRAPETLSSGRWVPSHTVIVLVVVCALLAVGIFGVRTMLSPTGRTTPRVSGPSRVAVSSHAASTEPPDRGVSGALTPGGQQSSGPTKRADHWSIHVVGAVRHPGVVRVAVDTRVADAVAAAGGLADNADGSGVNLARPLRDGEQVHVPRPGEKWTPPSDAAPGGEASAGPAGGGPGSGSAPGGGAAGGLININAAGLEQLDSLPGVGPVMAQRILDWRQEHGKFSSVDELGEVSGIGEKTLARLKPKVTV